MLIGAELIVRYELDTESPRSESQVCLYRLDHKPSFERMQVHAQKKYAGRRIHYDPVVQNAIENLGHVNVFQILHHPPVRRAVWFRSLGQLC